MRGERRGRLAGSALRVPLDHALISMTDSITRLLQRRPTGRRLVSTTTASATTASATTASATMASFVAYASAIALTTAMATALAAVVAPATARAQGAPPKVSPKLPPTTSGKAPVRTPATAPTKLPAPASTASTAAPATTPATTPAAPAQMARIFGIAYDSVAMRPLVGAMIQLVDGSDPTRIRSAETDAHGDYAIDSVRVGTYLLGFFHPRVDELAVETPLVRIDVRTVGEIRAHVAIPSARTISARVCGPAATRDSVGLFMGVVRSAHGAALSAPARVRAQWTELRVGTTGLIRTNPTQVVTTSPTGNFAICGVPTNGSFVVRAFVGPDSSGFVELEAPKRGLVYRDLYIGTATKMPTPAQPSTMGRTMAVFRGAGALKGVVRSSTTGQPVRDARLMIWGSGQEDTSNVNGQFALRSLPSGTYTVEARAIGFLPKRAIVDMSDSVETVADLNLDVFVPTIDTMRVRANRNPASSGYAEFEKRKKLGGGYFIDEEQLSKRDPVYMADVFRQTPGVTVSLADINGDLVLMRGAGSTPACVPTVFVDGMRVVNTDGNLENLINPQTVKAVEVYTRTASIPAQFQGQNGCGSLVIWTGFRKPLTSR